ncbi:MAG: acetylornithine deacetylase [Gammaproteobacteria bacterium]|nr:acetylornithine deacetylase [Gammaproteobacteria bacterium]MDE0252224.1 acetylornithine deacetylase [Gammaproteobacteria bacterium]MDE0402667.1 acetylornithine deacetylase [Gammaproteobacteria bacterium]
MTLPTFFEMLNTLVSSPSVSSLSPDLDTSNRAVIDHIANWLHDLDFDVDVLVSSDNRKFNLVARKGRGEGGVLLSGHSDTVPCDPDMWTQSPFSVKTDDSKYYGLGTCDMKGFFPVVLEVVQQFKESQLGRPITVLVTADEESTMAGARHIATHHPISADVAVIGEPTDLQPIFAHKGIFVARIRTVGKSGHSSNPTLGVSALEDMYNAIREIMVFRTELQKSNNDSVFAVPVPTLNLGCLHAGDSANRICGQAELLIDCRILPGMSTTEVVSRLEEQLIQLGSKLDSDIEFKLVMPPIEPFKTPSSSRFIQLMEKLSGRPSGTVAFGTEAPFLQQMGIETVIFGPGSIDQAHQANEYLSLAQIEPAKRALSQLIHEYCCK